MNLPGILDERDTPVCFVMDTWVYPFLCPDAIPSPTTCAANIDPDLNNPPNPFDIRNYRPNAFRMYCSAYLWIWDRAGQNATCQF